MAIQDTSRKGKPGGYPGLDSTGKVPLEQLPDLGGGGPHTHAQSDVTELDAALASKADAAATTSALAAKAPLAAPAFTGAVTTTGSLGYATGAGGTVTQATSKTTGVTLNKVCGTITMDGAALGVATIVTFTVTNSTVAATDVIHIQHDSVGTTGGYTVVAHSPAAGSFQVSVRNNTVGILSEAIVLRFAVIKAVIS